MLVFLLVAVTSNALGQAIPRAADAHKREFIRVTRQVWGLTAPAWLASQIEAESGWVDGLTSSANARGLCQVIPTTAAGVEHQYYGLANLGRYSARYCYYFISLHMRDLYRDFLENRDRFNAIRFASAAYNGAPSTLRSEIALCAADADCDPNEWSENVATKRARAIHHWRESRGYVARIARREPVYAEALWGELWTRDAIK